MESTFMPGLDLCAAFYAEAVAPILAARFPGLVHSAARLGEGSDVLGFDTPRSADHGWGPKLDLFLAEADHDRYAEDIVHTLAEELPFEFRGYPTNFSAGSDSEVLGQTNVRPIRHGVCVHTVRSFFTGYLGFDPSAGVEMVHWLICSSQRFRTVASGRVFHDGLGQLGPIREQLHYYPRDVWLYLLAVQWRRISQEEPFMGRAGDVGDELGSRIIAARLAQEIMRLCFLMESVYAPYSKWFGTAFARLACAPQLAPILGLALQGNDWRERERHLSLAYEAVAEMHNQLGITPPLPARVSPFFDRPYRVIHADAFSEALREAIIDPRVRHLPAHLGSVDQFSDSTDVLSYPERCRRLQLMYE